MAKQFRQKITTQSNLSETKIDLSENNLSGDNLSGFNLSGFNLSKANLSKANLKGTNLSDTNLSMTNLSGANLSGANLRGANLRGANLNGADFSGADFSEVNLSGFNLSEFNLSGANLSKANLSRAKFNGANLSKTNLSRVNLSRANLSGVNFSKANLSGVDFSGANLNKTNLSGANLHQTNFVDAVLDSATLTGAQLWETQRGGWSIKNVICDYAYWDRESKKPVHYALHEFEKLYSEKTKIILHYDRGISPLEISTLPALIQKLEKENKECNFYLETIKEDAGGATVTIVVEGADQHKIAYLNKQTYQTQNVQRQLVQEIESRRKFQYQLDYVTRLLESVTEETEGYEQPKQTIEKILKSKNYCLICGKNENEVERFINKSEISICENCLMDILDNEGITTRIQRSLVFKPEHKQAGISILSYFSEVVNQKYPDINVKIKIEQEQSTVRMIVETPKGEIKKIEETLDQYGMVVQGQIPPNQLLHNPLEIMALEQKLERSALELRHTKELLDTAKIYNKENKEKIFQLEDQVKSLHNIIGESLRGTKSAHLLIRKLLDKYNSNDIVKDSLELIEKKISVGIKPSDKKEIKQTLESIKRENPKVLKELSDFVKGSITGVGGNLLYSWIITVSNALPK